ncbi:extracellular solute-binding protein [Opitutaceae bacterium TAV4]|nr:extracellular solute-binding protein [Opitutaceae bacterium TAV4]RRJ99089.1 extracellular solute-binding protein [Opitutaceae bacterium TAV3]
MKRLLPLVGFALLAVAFSIALFKVFTRASSHRDPGTKVIRIGHWLIHDGMREAFAEIIADYERAHPGVRVEQNAVPLKTWFAWQRAQWTGGTTPDIMQLGKGTTDAELGRYYLPLSSRIDAPNPYNAGTPLAGIPWRETFVDGLASGMTYNAALGEIFGIPAQINTVRFFYNRHLLRAITGRDTLDGLTLDEFLELGRAAREYATRTARPIVPLSVCGPYAEGLLDQISGALTQRHVLDDPARTLRNDPARFAADHLAGNWKLDTPDIRRVLELWSEIAALAQPGYAQLQREDAHFTFVTGSALFLYAGSWDYSGITQQARFPVGVMRIPLPRPGEGRYGEFTLGVPSEVEAGLEAIMGISRDSPHPELAVDFLRWLTSYPMAVKFSALSRRISAVVDVPAPADLDAVRPAPGGLFGGPSISLRIGSNSTLVFNQNLHFLDARPLAGDDARRGITPFIEAVNARWTPAIQRDLEHVQRARLRNVRTADTRAIFANSQPASSDAETAVTLSGVDVVFEAVLDQELMLARLRDSLAP